MADRDLVAALESRLVNAWPAFEVELAEGWLLRFAEGYSKRANAATPIVPGARLDASLVRHVLAAFETRGVPACFRLTGLEDPEADRVLEEAGLTLFDPTLGMRAPLDAVGPRDPSVRIEPAAKAAWVASAAAAQAGVGVAGRKADPAVLGRIVRLIRQPAGFATLEFDGRDSAWGFAVCERGLVGLYDIAVAPDLRGLGLGRRLVETLLAWGQEAGASAAYLQMSEANAVAAGLYGSLGFTTAYRYVHRVVPGEVGRERRGAVATTAPAAIRAQAPARAHDSSA